MRSKLNVRTRASAPAAGSVHGVVVAAGDVRRERLFRRVTRGTVAAIVRERDRLDEGHAQSDSARDTSRDLRDLDRVREARAQVIVFGGDVDLTLACEPA